jgi:transposase
MKTLKAEIRKEIKEEFKNASKKPLDIEEFRMYVNQLFQLDEIQTKFKNQRRACVSNKIIKYDELFPEIEKLRRIENSTDGDKKKIAKLIKEALVRQLNKSFEINGIETRVDIKTVEKYVYDIAQKQYDEDRASQVMEMAEIDRLKDVEKYMEENLPIFYWCRDVRGLGTKLTAKLLAGIGDIRRFPNPASLWSYSGVGDAEKSKRVTGQTLRHSPKMRATLYNLQESFIKAGSQYRVIYDKRKERTLKTRPEWHNLVPCPVKNVGKYAPKTDENGNITWANQHPKHAHVDASRVMIKRFLAELFAAWYQSLEMEPPAKPYGVEIAGHHEDPMIMPYKSRKGTIELKREDEE